jgi:nephrocystin-3
VAVVTGEFIRLGQCGQDLGPHDLHLGGDYLSEEAIYPTRQDALKQKVKAVCQAKKIPMREDYADPHALAALVLADLTAALDAEFPPDQMPDVWAREDRDHESYAKSRRTDFYVGRDTYFNRLDAYADGGAQGCGLTVLGESGGGKSALLANWVAHRRQAHPCDFVFQHYIGSSAMSAGHLALMRRLMVAIVRWCGADDPAGSLGLEEEEKKIPAKTEEIVKLFPDYLGRLSAEAKRKGVGAVLVLDAINQLEDRERGRLLAWLPRCLSGDLRLVISTLPGDTLDALQPRGWPALTVEPLTASERVWLIARYLAHFAQGLSEARARKIAGAEASSNPLYIKTLLDDLRATGNHLSLDRQIDDYLRAADIPALLGKILARFERDYERDRPGLVREALSLLWAARRGLTEPELLEALGPVRQSVSSEPAASLSGQNRLPAAVWSPVRCALEDGLVDRDGVLGLAHEHLRMAVERRYVPDATTARILRLRLADNFAGRPVDARQADELPWLLRQAESSDRLRACLLDIDRFLLMRESDENELLGYWVWLKEERVQGSLYVRSFNDWTATGIAPAHLATVAHLVGAFLCHASLYADAEPLIRRALSAAEQHMGVTHPILTGILTSLMDVLQETSRLEDAEPVMRRIMALDEDRYGHTHQRIAQDLSNLGQLLVRHKPSEAEHALRRAIAICQCNGFGPDSPLVAASMSNLAMLLRENGRNEEAESLAQTALAAAQRTFGPAHPTVAVRMNNLATILRETGRTQEAEPLARRSLAITEKSFGPHHPQVAICLGNLAIVLEESRRWPEAEALMLRSVEILLEVTHDLGRPHQRIQDALLSYAMLLDKTGLERNEIAVRLSALCRRHEVDPEQLHSPVLLTQEAVQSKYKSLMARMKAAPEHASAVFERLRTEDPAFFQLMQARIENWKERNQAQKP